MNLAHIFKHNPYHDPRNGQFTSGPGGSGDLPPAPGTAPIPEGHVRLYHQTSEENALSIGRTGLDLAHAKGIEGPRAVYASETGFYGKPDSRPTVEFHVPKDKWEAPFVLEDVKPSSIVAIHLPWHKQARYLLANPESMKKALAGDFDDLGGDYGRAVAYVKARAKITKFNPYHGPDGRFASGPGGAKHGANHPAAASIRLHQIMLGVRMSSLLSGVRISPNQNKPGSNRLLSPFGHILKGWRA